VKVAIGDDVYNVTLWHDLEQHSTTCVITVEGDPVSVGFANAHPNDPFNKAVGRRLALARALESGNFSRDDRRAFWQAARSMGWKGVR
jgi:hypothetical protein